MRGLQAQQESVLQMEKYEKIEIKQKKKREIIERRMRRREAKINNEVSSSEDSDSQS
jgi:hypothetical protein